MTNRKNLISCEQQSKPNYADKTRESCKPPGGEKEQPSVSELVKADP